MHHGGDVVLPQLLVALVEFFFSTLDLLLGPLRLEELAFAGVLLLLPPELVQLVVGRVRVRQGHFELLVVPFLG